MCYPRRHQVHKNEDFRMYKARLLCSDEATDLALITG
jgi:hypothetical protein